MINEPYRMKSVDAIVCAINWRLDREEPPEKLLNVSRNKARDIFKRIGYEIHDTDEFEKIIDFIARHEISLFDVRSESSNLWRFAENWGIVGKRFSKPRGLFLYGPYGTGKTTAARVIAEMFDAAFLTVESLSWNYRADEGEDWLHEFIRKNARKMIIIDDIGNEDEMKKYGNSSPLPSIISSRALSYEWFGVPTVYTSNFLGLKELGEAYDDRITSRFVGTVDNVLIGGKDRRYNPKET